MGDHVAVDVGGLIASRAGEAVGLPSCGKEVAALIGMVECRICPEEDLPKNLESPCACNGSLKVHASCSELGFCLQFSLLMLFSLQNSIDLGT
jgi:hypothetical protein